MPLLNPAEKLILALDGMSSSEVFLLIDNLPDLVWVKVGLELFTSNGPQVLTRLREKGKKVFLDLKYHDIPQTMAKACSQAALHGAELITVHASAGEKALSAANKAALMAASEASFPPPTLLAVTVLTSWTSQSFTDDLGISESIEKRVERLTALAIKSGIGGCVCSPLEVRKLRSIYPEPFQLVTPGIRFSGSSFDDQARVMEPLEALSLGASKLVLGRIITNSSNPAEVFNKICRDIVNN